VYDARPHLLYFSLPAAWGLPILFLAIVFMRISGFFADALRYVLLLAVFLWSLWSLWHLVQWWFTRCTVSNYRVVWRQGVIARSGVEIPLDRVSNVNFHQSMLERVLGAGDLVIESSGESGQSRFSDIRHPDDVQLLIHQQINSRSAASRPVAATATLLESLQELERLRTSGTLTEEEFIAAKQKLLG
jgi:uncharacterized membrane protein YdbT with pleckstrin-like domain